VKTRTTIYILVAITCISVILDEWVTKRGKKKKSMNASSVLMPAGWCDPSAVERLGMVRSERLTQKGMQPEETTAGWLEQRERLRQKRLAKLSPVVFLKNTEFGNAPRLDMSLSDGPCNGCPFKAGASIMMLVSTGDGRGRVGTLLDNPKGMIRDLDVSYDGKRIPVFLEKEPAPGRLPHL